MMKSAIKRVANSLGLVSLYGNIREVKKWQGWEHARDHRASPHPHFKFVFGGGQDAVSVARRFLQICRKAVICYTDETFIYSPDFAVLSFYKYNPVYSWHIHNVPIDPANFIRGGIAGLKMKLTDAKSKFSDSSMPAQTIESFESCCSSLEIYVNRCLALVRESNDVRAQKIAVSLSDLLHGGARDFHSALQGILIINSLLWTTNMKHVGLGLLCEDLKPYYDRELAAGTLSVDGAKAMLKDALVQLHRDFYRKSALLPGDTGQVITAIGTTDDAGNFNELTGILMDAVAELKLPDPKIVLRLDSHSPQEIIDKAVNCLLSGTGSPLISNDAQVLQALQRFGYSEADAKKYATSACWEPCLPGLSSDQNNLITLNFLTPLQTALEKIVREHLLVQNLDTLYQEFESALSVYFENETKQYVDFKFEANPFLSLFSDDCILQGRDASDDGYRYHYLGILSVGVGNAVNAMLNIDSIVFRGKKTDIAALLKAQNSNFANAALLGELQGGDDKFGTSSEVAVALTNRMIASAKKSLEMMETKYNKKFRFGISSPGYITFSEGAPGSLDGRRNGEPFCVHISAFHSGHPVTPTEAAWFSSKLDYMTAFNGGITDVVIDKSCLDPRRHILGSYIMGAIEEGVYQLQFNVLDVDTLHDAKAHPERYPNLIVRVWGFSAYFTDLPASYQDIIIKRAEGAHAVGF